MIAEISYALLALGCALQVIAALGLAVGRDAFDRLHLSAPATLGALIVAAAVLVHESFSIIGLKAILFGAFLAVTGPLLVHIIGRALRVAERGDWRIGSDERIEVEP